MKEVLEKEIKSILRDLGVKNPEVTFGVSVNTEFGDYSSGVALKYAKELGKAPIELAEEIKSKLKIPSDYKISVSKPGYVNVAFSHDFFAEVVKNILEKKYEFGKNENLKDKVVLVEHSSPNLFKAFNIGHIMNNAIGESVARIAAFSGANVTTISYPSDISLGIAKAVWFYMKDGGPEKIKKIGQPSEIMVYLGECYVNGTNAYENSPEIQAEVRKISDEIYKKDKASQYYKAYLEAKDYNLAYFKAITSTLGSKFDDTNLIYESETSIIGEKLVRENIGNVFKESEGAVIYEGEQDGLHTRVFINKEGHPTYEAKDLGLLSIKFSKYNPDLSIFVTDHEQEEYFKVVSAAARKINPVWSERTVHLTHGRMTLRGQKMSSRLGGVPSAQELLNQLYDALNIKAPDLANQTDGESNRYIAVATLKFRILRSNTGKNIDFDPDALSLEGDSGPYLQYATVRANSLLKKAEVARVTLATKLPENWETTNLERILERFPGVVERAGKEYAPHHIVTYLIDLAGEFNSFYAGYKIIPARPDARLNDTVGQDPGRSGGDETDPTSPYRLALTQAFYQVMQNGLNLLGIKVPEKM